MCLFVACSCGQLDEVYLRVIASSGNQCILFMKTWITEFKLSCMTSMS